MKPRFARLTPCTDGALADAKTPRKESAMLSVDPGACTGWAYWRLGKLVSCGICTPENFRQVVPAEAFNTSKLGIIELPMVYKVSKAPPKDIIRLAVRVGILTEKMLAAGIPEVIELCPTTWKGQVPKEIHHARLFAKLSPAEQEVVRLAGKSIAPSLRNNMLDGIGLGLYKVMVAPVRFKAKSQLIKSRTLLLSSMPEHKSFVWP